MEIPTEKVCVAMLPLRWPLRGLRHPLFGHLLRPWTIYHLYALLPNNAPLHSFNCGEYCLPYFQLLLMMPSAWLGFLKMTLLNAERLPFGTERILGIGTYPYKTKCISTSVTNFGVIKLRIHFSETLKKTPLISLTYHLCQPIFD